MCIALGFKYYPPLGPRDAHQDERILEVVLIGDGHFAHVNAIICRCPESHRTRLATYLSPFLVGKFPEKSGDYTNELIMWWKKVEVMP